MNKRLIQRCANALTWDQEFSGQEAINYLMGWGDRYESHHYVVIYWGQCHGSNEKAVSQAIS